jgi:hypothetical protein
VPDWIQHDGDVIHHMEVTLTVTWPDLVVAALEGSMRTFPRGVWREREDGGGRRTGFTRAVNERIDAKG